MADAPTPENTPDLATDPTPTGTPLPTTTTDDGKLVVADESGVPVIGSDSSQAIEVHPELGIPVVALTDPEASAPQGTLVVADPVTGAPATDANGEVVTVDPAPQTTQLADGTTVVADPAAGGAPLTDINDVPIAVTADAAAPAADVPPADAPAPASEPVIEATGVRPEQDQPLPDAPAPPADGPAADAPTADAPAADTSATDAPPPAADAPVAEPTPVEPPPTSNVPDLPIVPPALPLDQHPAPSDITVKADPITGLPHDDANATPGGTPAPAEAPAPVPVAAPTAGNVPDNFVSLSADGQKLAEAFNEAVEHAGTALALELKGTLNYAHALLEKLEAAAEAKVNAAAQTKVLKQLMDALRGVKTAGGPLFEEPAGSSTGDLDAQAKASIDGIEDEVSAAFDGLLSK